MNVCKCDRCGKYIDSPAIPVIRGIKNPEDYIPESIKMDLCPECYGLLEKFLKGDKDESNSNNN